MVKINFTSGLAGMDNPDFHKKTKGNHIFLNYTFGEDWWKILTCKAFRLNHSLTY